MIYVISAAIIESLVRPPNVRPPSWVTLRFFYAFSSATHRARWKDLNCNLPHVRKWVWLENNLPLQPVSIYRDSELTLLEFRRLLKTHLFSRGPRRLVTTAVSFTMRYRCTYTVLISLFVDVTQGLQCNELTELLNDDDDDDDKADVARCLRTNEICIHGRQTCHGGKTWFLPELLLPAIHRFVNALITSQFIFLLRYKLRLWNIEQLSNITKIQNNCTRNHQKKVFNLINAYFTQAICHNRRQL